MVKIIKTLRFTAQMLIFATALTLLSGFVSAKPFFAPFFGGLNAYYFHVVVVPLLFVPLVYTHSLMGILLFFERNQKYNTTLLKFFACGLWTALFILFGFMYFGPTVASRDTVNTANIVLDSAEIARHNTEADCWIIISGQVYNMSNYAQSHSGGAQAIDAYCGKDGTVAFDTKNGNGVHSQKANDILASFLIGDFGSKVKGNSVTTKTTNTVPQIPPVNVSSATPKVVPVSSKISLTASVVATHNVESDCWMIINNKVYNLSGYATEHPGGTQNITSYCGKEATVAFDTKGGQGNSHSGGANSYLTSLYIGDLNASVAPSAMTSVTPPAIPTQNYGEEYDD